MTKLNQLEISFQIRPKSASPASCDGALSTNQPGRLPRVTQVLAMAINFEEMIRRGEAKDYADIARLGGLCRERVSQIMRLNALAPDIQVEMLYLPPTATGRYPVSESAVRKIANLLSWTGQREQWIKLKGDLGG